MADHASDTLPSATSAGGASAPEAWVGFCLDELTFAVDLRRVVRVLQVVEITPLPGAPAVVAGAIGLAGEVLPVIDLRARLGRPRPPVRLSDQLLIVQAKSGTVALLADTTVGVLSHAPGPLASDNYMPPELRSLEGIFVSEGQLVLVYDLERLLRPNEESSLQAALLAARDNTTPAAVAQEP